MREERLTTTERALRQANLRTTEFLATLSHELRNPLAPIRNSLFLLERTEPGSDMARKAQAVIGRQVTHMTRLVDDLLDITRITRGKVQLQRERIEFGEIVRRTVEDHRLSFEDSGIHVECRIDSGPFWVDADPARLIQVLTNLLGNAEKFTPRGQRVVVTLQQAHTKLLLDVRDTGVGIASDVLQHLFEPFAQAPQTMDRSRGGLGLGLATVKGLVELHGGTVTISSDGQDKGTSATVLLPLAQAASQVAVIAQKVPDCTRRVLIIEDNEDAAKTLRAALTMCGHEVEMAYDGSSGIKLARSFGPEVVICDVGLPLMDGYEVAQALRAMPSMRGVYLVALSGYAASEDVARAMAAGFDKHVAKPLSVEAIDRIVREGS
jgi:CheY-like chemotaxis protein